MDYIVDLIDYWLNAGFYKFFRVFWYFLLFEFVRYLALDFVVLIVFKLNNYFNRERYQKAREALWIESPLVSIIIPGKNEGPHIYKLVESLKHQTYQNFELIVIDDGSTDKTPYICTDLQKRGLIHLFLRNDIRGGKASAANLGWRYSKGKYIIHLDADCTFDKQAIENILIPFYYYENLGAVGGSLEVRNHKTSVATSLQAIEYLKSISIGRMVTSFLGIYAIISGAFGAFRKDVLDRVGGWDIGPGLDGDITVKIRKLGYKVKFESRALGFTNAPDTFKKLYKQRLRWNKSVIRFRLRKHKDVFYPNENFRFTNFFASAENIFSGIILNFKWFIYVFDMLFNYAGVLKYIVPVNLVLYTLANYFQFLVVLILSKTKTNKLRLLWYMPLMVFYYGLFLRLSRLSAHTKELFFRSSYKDSWNPAKSSNQAKRMKI